jgi:hypothetical protein
VGFIVIHPFILIYYKSLGLFEAEHSSNNRSVELIVLSKEDIVANRKQRNNTHNIFKKSITEPVSYLTINETENVQLTYNNHNEKKYSFVWKEVITPPPQTLISTI